MLRGRKRRMKMERGIGEMAEGKEEVKKDIYERRTPRRNGRRMYMYVRRGDET